MKAALHVFVHVLNDMLVLSKLYGYKVFIVVGLKSEEGGSVRSAAINIFKIFHVSP